MGSLEWNVRRRDIPQKGEAYLWKRGESDNKANHPVGDFKRGAMRQVITEEATTCVRGLKESKSPSLTECSRSLHNLRLM